MPRKQLTVVAPAKLNLTLDINGVLPGGYHEVSMVLQSLSLCDRVVLSRAEGAVEVDCPKYLPQGEDNIVHRAAMAFFSAAGLSPEGIRLKVVKKIPVAAGLGGGSADAAATLFGLNQWFESPLSIDQLLETGASVGADVPFCLLGGTMLAEGFGEKLRPLDPMPDCHLVLVQAGKKDSTGAMYARYDSRVSKPAETTPHMLSALEKGKLPLIARALGNAFDKVANRKESEKIRSLLEESGALGCSLSGSGPTYYGLFAREDQALLGARRLSRRGYEPLVCRPVPWGCYMVLNIETRKPGVIQRKMGTI